MYVMKCIKCRLCKKTLDQVASDRFLFMDPAVCAADSIKNDKVGAPAYVTDVALKAKDHQYIFLPYLQRYER